MCRSGGGMWVSGGIRMRVWVRVWVVMVVVESPERGARDSEGVVGPRGGRQRRRTHELEGVQVQTRTRDRARGVVRMGGRV